MEGPVLRGKITLRTKLSYALQWVGEGGKRFWRSAPVPERSKHQTGWRSRFHDAFIVFHHCCARGRAHSENATSAITDPLPNSALEGARQSSTRDRKSAVSAKR